MSKRSLAETIEYVLGFVGAAIPLLEDYLLSKDMYWSLAAEPPAGNPPYSELTLGSLLLALARLRARPLPSDQNAGLIRLERELEQIRSRWRVAWEKKSQREFSSRLKLWRDFLEEYRLSPENNYDRYAYEVRKRVMLHLLAGEAGSLPQAELELLAGLDRLLRAVFVYGDFIWAKDLSGGFPPDAFWYLYGQLKRG